MRTVCVVIPFFCLAVLLQWLSGAYSAGFSGPDEPAHYVTGLMVHDYLHSWPPASPMRFAEDFYTHYPEVAMGHWPPLFYAVQGVWMSLTSTSRASVLILMAVFTALLAFTTYRFVRIDFGDAVGLASGVLLICTPLVQRYSAQVMAEIPVALFCLWGALAFGRYLETGEWRFSAWFGLFASLGILTKGTGFAVLPVVLALVPLRRLKWLARPSFWIAPAIVIALCGLWYRFTMNMVRNGWEEKPGLAFMAEAMPWNAWQLARILGVALLPVVVVGLAVKLIRPKAAEARWTALGMLIVGVWLFQSIVPASLAERHFVTAAAPLVMFLIVGAAWFVSHVPVARLHPRTKAAVVAMIISVVFLGTQFRIPRFSPGPFHSVVSDLLARLELRDAVFLVSSQNYGEGRFIAEMAMREHRPGHIVLRGSKMLAEGDWFGLENTLLYPSTDEVMRFLGDIPVTILVLHQGGGGKTHPDYVQLVELIRQNPTIWESIGTYSARDADSGTFDEVQVYQYRNRVGPRVGKIRIDLHRMLGRSIER
jgi:4-amino-4-deoxy-L-arabinose transferase-like glycosyltransferase